MTRGKRTCKILKEIRQQIAEKNDITLVTSECTFQGECKGTCPKCEQEVRYLESELRKRQQLGKVVTIAGISLGIAGSFVACGNTPQQNETVTTEQESTEKIGQIVEDSKKSLVDSVNVNVIAPVKKRIITKPIVLEENILISEATIIDISIVKLGYPSYRAEVGIIGYTKKRSKWYIYNYYNVDKAPSFPNGNDALKEFIAENLVYPKKAVNKGLIGTTTVKFVVNANGKVRNPKIVQSSGKMLDKQALSLVRKLPRFIAGEENGRKVRVYYELPVEFKLPKEKEFAACDTATQQSENTIVEQKLPKVPEVTVVNTTKIDTVVQEQIKPVTILKTKPTQGYVEAEFPDGSAALMKYLHEKIYYPQDALDEWADGTVVIEFVVRADGSIDNIKVLKNQGEIYVF